jgi:hemolysin activation/secretion protein
MLAAALAALPLAAAADCAPARGGAALGRVVFTTPSAILPSAELDAIADRFAGCRRDPRSVEAVIGAVNAAYAARGADLAFADFAGTRGRTVQIALIEVRYDAVEVEGATIVSPDFLRARAGAAPGALADMRALEARLARLPETDGLRVEADLRPGVRPGTTTLVLRVEEPPRLRAVIGADNTGAVDSGQARLTGALTISSLTGLADPVTFSASLSEGSRQAAVAYARPLGTGAARLSFGLSVETTEAIFAPPPGNALTTTGVQATAGIAWPLRASDAGTDGLTAALTVAFDSSALAGVPVSDTAAVEVAIGTTHLRRFPGRGLVGLSHALRAGTVDDRVTPAGHTYLRYEGTAFALAALSSDWTLGAEARWQYATGPVPTFAQFSATGRSGVRGYGRVTATNDAGALLRAELRRAPLDAGGGLRLSPFGFADAGFGASHGAAGLVAGPLRASVGLGLDAAHDLGGGRTLAGSLVVALPLADALPRLRAGEVQIVASVSVGF